MFDYKKINYLLKQNQFYSKILQDKHLLIYHSFLIEVSLPHIICIKKHYKTTCSSKLYISYIKTNTLQFFKDMSITGYLLIFTR